ncbi:serine/threonine-protein kinase [Azospirillum picis]|uniref:Aminoglycoside phosphotransferase (APT) family kinase protein n=1 Tax=Azospirillum picis TaxID=488438 RepID=A0ABU0MG81_9PROT|nr:serine/threonine-protein kinase [Azospirillum picis]MBP2298511.1 aminoglycoside phosphotransferase (APT) family kinase protein [Azospirillum picis]MDQ0532440.1 aminoglycoside phosphotransferase (APT) family kinase protein [Azospirillum picis]
MSSSLHSHPAPRPASVVGSIDEAELCSDLSDYHALPARTVIGIALRPYLDPLFLTPTELIHLAKPLRNFLDQGQLAETAVTKVAMVQGRMPGQDQQWRRKVIRNAIDESLARARAAQAAFAAMPRGHTPVGWLLALKDKTPTGDQVYDLRVALALELTEIRNWGGKLDRLLALYQGDRDERLAMGIDGIVGDILASVGAAADLFGGTLLPGTLLVKLCEMLFGRVGMDAFGPNRIGVLNALFRQGKLPVAKAAVLNRVRRQLKEARPLGRGAFDQEAEVLKTLTGHLLTHDGLIGGAAMADALTVRYSRRLEQGGATAYRRSIIGLSEGQSDLICRIHYLTRVAAAPAAERHADEIIASLEAAVGNELLIENMLVQTPDIMLLERAFARALAAIRSAPLAADSCDRIASKAERAVDDYVKSGQLAVRLRQVEPVSRRRVLRLAEFACSGLVRQDGGLPLLRQHIMEVVRQPHFQLELAQPDGDSAHAERRRLLDLLDRMRQMATTPAPSPGAMPSLTTATLPADRQMSPTVLVGLPDQVPSVGTAAAGAPPASEKRRCPSCFTGQVLQGACLECGFPERSDSRRGVHMAPGTRLQDRYACGRVLGQGGFGATYLGWDERLEVKVAIKEYYPAALVARLPGGLAVAPFSDEHAESFATGLSKFLEEARTLARLREIREIVTIQDFFEQNGTAYLVMELLEGRTMKKYLADCGGRIDVKRALGVLMPIAKALQAIHEQGLIHRDISPDNIFLTSGGDRKLLDFGAARQAVRGGPGLTVILKPGYAPPEQYSSDGRQGPWTDVYALCATIYQALTGRTPPDATARFLNDKVPRPAELGVQVPAAFEKVMISGLAMRWQDRPQSMKDLLRAMTGALSGG